MHLAYIYTTSRLTIVLLLAIMDHNPSHESHTPVPPQHLPADPQAKEALIKEIQRYREALSLDPQLHEDKIRRCELRLRLTRNHGMSMERIDNLQSIFLHYCSHIFKTGKHMTFERLEYEKNHLTMDRFFTILKDFGLTQATVNGSVKEVLDKQEVVLLFKKMSPNCKDLNFEQFIAMLERVALMYYHEKDHYTQKVQRIERQRKARKQQYLRSMKKRQAAIEAAHSLINGRQGTGHEDGENQEEEPEGEAVDEDKKTEQDEEIAPENKGMENDDLMESMMNDKNLKDPLKEVEKELAGSEEEGDKPLEQRQEAQGNKQGAEKGPDNRQAPQPQQPQSTMEQRPPQLSIQEPYDIEGKEYLLELTRDEKIEYYYELIDVDNAASFRKKMTELNLPLFSNKHKRAASHGPKASQPLHTEQFKAPSPRTVRNMERSQIEEEDKHRISQLRSKFEERKEHKKGGDKLTSRQDYDYMKKRKREEKQDKSQPTPGPNNKRPHKDRKMEVTELQTDLSSLSKMNAQSLHFRRFNPAKLMGADEDDYFLMEYSSGRAMGGAGRSHRALSGLEPTEKSQMMLQKLRKRAKEIEHRERTEESKYEINQDVSAPSQHQIRKNRLVEKLRRAQL